MLDFFVRLVKRFLIGYHARQVITVRSVQLMEQNVRLEPCERDRVLHQEMTVPRVTPDISVANQDLINHLVCVQKDSTVRNQ